MKMHFLLIAVGCFGVYQLHAYGELLNPLTDSKKVIAKGIALHDAGKYKAAISEYVKVPSNDWDCFTVLHELILSYCKGSNFVEAERYGNIELAFYLQVHTKWHSLLPGGADLSGEVLSQKFIRGLKIIHSSKLSQTYMCLWRNGV